MDLTKKEKEQAEEQVEETTEAEEIDLEIPPMMSELEEYQVNIWVCGNQIIRAMIYMNQMIY